MVAAAATIVVLVVFEEVVVVVVVRLGIGCAGVVSIEILKVLLTLASSETSSFE